MFESVHNEFKLSLNDNLEKEVVAFLNSKDGGNIYIGVNDLGDVVGVNNIDYVQLEIKNRIKNNINPSTLGLFDVLIKKIKEKNVIHIVIASGSEKPYYIKKKGMSPLGSFIRVGNSIESLSDDKIMNMFSKRTKTSLRKITSPTQNLSFSQLKIFYQELGYEIEDNFLYKLELFNDDKLFNYVAYLLSDNNTISIKVAKYKGLDTFNLVENDEYGYCCLIKAAKNVLNRLEMENRTFTKITAQGREEIKRIEPIALKEAVINALIHNDYTYELAAKFEIFDDRLEISSNGGLPERVELKDFLGGFSAPRNKELMRVFKDIGLVEQLGTGIRRILKFYPQDVFEIYPNFIKVTFKFKSSNLTTQKEEKTKPLNITQQNILKIILNDPNVTQEAIAKTLNISRRTVIRHMNVLEKLNCLKRVGDNRNGYWAITSNSLI